MSDTIITITIKSGDNTNSADETAGAIGVSVDTGNDNINDCQILDTTDINPADVSTAKPKRNKRRSRREKLWVDNEQLLAALISAGYADKLHGVNWIDGRQLFFFDREPDILDVISWYVQYKAGNNAV